MGCKFTALQKDFHAALTISSRAVPNRPNHPVLANILLVAKEEDQIVEVIGYDLSLGIRCSFPAAIEEEGSITLPAKLLGDIISRLPEGEISLDNRDGAIANIKSSSGNYQVQGMDADEYPDMGIVDGNATKVKLDPDAILNGLKGTLFATSSDETKQILCGVHIKIQPETLEFAATDGHRLSVFVNDRLQEDADTDDEVSDDEEEISVDEEEIEITIPAKALREVERAIASQKEPINMRFNREETVFEFKNAQITARVLEGHYPNYPQLIPVSFANLITVNRKFFLNAVERIAILADQKNNILKCGINHKKQEIALSVDAKDVGSGREYLKAEITSDEPEVIAFNVKYLIEGLKAITSAEVQISINTEYSPVILSPLGGAKMTYLIMPVQLRN